MGATKLQFTQKLETAIFFDNENAPNLNKYLTQYQESDSQF